MKRAKGIAAILFLLLTMPLPRACALVPHGAAAQQDCCQHQDRGSMCGRPSSGLCCAARIPADTPYPAQTAMPLQQKAASTAVVYDRAANVFAVRPAAQHAPPQHSPPGLVIAATIVLRI